jgi:RpiR family glv operon transcriptional regulator
VQLEQLINKHYNKLNENDLYVLKYILNHKKECYQDSITELAKKCNVSRSSILRLAQKLDFSGYSEFRIFLIWEDKTVEVHNHYFESLISDVESNIKALRNTNMEGICRLLKDADRIFVYGSGTAQNNCAKELQRSFVAVRKYLTVIQDKTEFDLMLPDIKPEDLLIIISLSGETPELIPLAKLLSVRGIPFVSITNLKNNLLAQLTPYNLYATSKAVQIGEDKGHTTFVPFFLVGEALLRSYVDYMYGNK